MSTEHELKVLPPYFRALLDETKTFELRENDRAFQTGDILILREWHPDQTNSTRPCKLGCSYWRSAFGHWREGGAAIRRRITFIYSGDPRLGGIEPGYVILGLERVA